MNYSEKIFEMLGVKPYEEFYIKNKYQFHNPYRINANLEIEICGEPCLISDHVNLRNILLGEYKIIKIPKLTRR